ncbi:MAG: phosphoribosyltransferase [Desulfurococcaceae archaeon]|nr:phosphoribosyltransferase [Desulfurococcaceae archaeon]
MRSRVMRVKSRYRQLVVRKPLEHEVSVFAEKIVRGYGGTKADRLKLRLLARDVLRLLKPVMSYRDLYSITGLPESVLCRYVKGSILPSFEQAVRILAKIALSVDLNYLLKDLVEQEKSPVIDLLRVLKDPYIARLLATIVMLELVGKEITKIVATAEAVLPIVSLISVEFNAPVVLVKRRSYPGVQYYSTTIMKSPKDIESLFVDRDLISKKDRLLVVADVVYTGRTLEAVLQILEKSKAEVVDVIAVLGLGRHWEERLKPYNVKVLSVVPFEL